MIRTQNLYFRNPECQKFHLQEVNMVEIRQQKRNSIVLSWRALTFRKMPLFQIWIIMLQEILQKGIYTQVTNQPEIPPRNFLQWNSLLWELSRLSHKVNTGHIICGWTRFRLFGTKSIYRKAVMKSWKLKSRSKRIRYTLNKWKLRKWKKMPVVYFCKSDVLTRWSIRLKMSEYLS